MTHPHGLRRCLPAILAFAGAILAAVLIPPQAHAANLQISPVSISLRGAQTAAGITLQNFGDQPLYGQVRVFTWDQKDGEEVLLPATEVVASPPIIEVAARASQTVRLVRRDGQPPAREQTYRILIDEIPRLEPGASGVAIRLQYSVPVFVLPSDVTLAPRLAWSLLKRDGAWFLRARNDGGMHAQIGATTVRTAAGKEIALSKGLLGYALAGRSREWRLDAGSAAIAAPLAIRTTVNAQALEASADRE
ncbi:molecular chaperone [Massilia sp. UMI-21]|nr:molecular chaperone [Massilia sp. UMI-21]